MLRGWFSVLGIGIATASLLSACAVPTAVTAESELQPNEGLVALRVIDAGEVPIQRFTVVADGTGQEFPLRAVRFGQDTTMTYVGRLPAGRYRPGTLTGSVQFNALRSVGRTVPLEKLTGKFDVEPRRVTDLGTMVFTDIDDKRSDERTSRTPNGVETTWVRSFELLLDPMPVPTDALIKARFPLLAKAVDGKSALNWVPGTVPPSAPRKVDVARQRTALYGYRAFIRGGDMLWGGQLGVISRFPQGSSVGHRVTTSALHAIVAVIELKDGHWLAGGEEGYLAVSADAGATWRQLPSVGSEAVVIHLSQAPDGRLFMVADLDREAVVYAASPESLDWQVIRRLPSNREQGALMPEVGAAAPFLFDYAAASPDKLVVFTRPARLNVLDLRSGQWDTHETPGAFIRNIELTPDGYLVGMIGPTAVYGSLDYGKTWTKLEGWANTTQPHFFDRQRGVIVSATVGLAGLGPAKVRFTQDGGKTWQDGAGVPPPYGMWSWPWLQPLWSDPAGTTLYWLKDAKYLAVSQDQGKNWR